MYYNTFHISNTFLSLSVIISQIFKLILFSFNLPLPDAKPSKNQVMPLLLTDQRNTYQRITHSQGINKFTFMKYYFIKKSIKTRVRPT